MGKDPPVHNTHLNHYTSESYRSFDVEQGSMPFKANAADTAPVSRPPNPKAEPDQHRSESPKGNSPQEQQQLVRQEQSVPLLETVTVDGSIAALVSTITIVQGSYAAFSRWISRVKSLHTSQRFSGFIAMDVIPSSPYQFMLIVRYKTNEELWGWLNSKEREEWIVSAKDTILDPSKRMTFRLVTSKFWSQQLSDQHQHQVHEPSPPCEEQPNYHMMAVITFFVIWPLVHFIVPGMAPYFQTPILLEIFSTIAIVVVAHYIGIPSMIRLFACCLFPKKEDADNPSHRCKEAAGATVV